MAFHLHIYVQAGSRINPQAFWTAYANQAEWSTGSGLTRPRAGVSARKWLVLLSEVLGTDVNVNNGGYK
jgi:hypothetical protein